MRWPTVKFDPDDLTDLGKIIIVDPVMNNKLSSDYTPHVQRDFFF
jgi:hypothetical protein